MHRRAERCRPQRPASPSCGYPPLRSTRIQPAGHAGPRRVCRAARCGASQSCWACRQLLPGLLIVPIIRRCHTPASHTRRAPGTGSDTQQGRIYSLGRPCQLSPPIAVVSQYLLRRRRIARRPIATTSNAYWRQRSTKLLRTTFTVVTNGCADHTGGQSRFGEEA